MITKLTKNFSLLILLVLLVFSCAQPKDDKGGEVETAEESTGEEPESAPIASPRKTASGTIAGAGVTVDYGSPAVKGREVWGGLEPYGKVWRAGANETSSIEFSGAVTIGNTKVPQGKYGFYLIPNESEPWVAILNTDWNRDEHGAWGAYNYNRENDVVRIEVSPEWGEEINERLSYIVKEDGIMLSWEKMTVKIPVSAMENG